MATQKQYSPKTETYRIFQHYRSGRVCKKGAQVSVYLSELVSEGSKSACKVRVNHQVHLDGMEKNMSGRFGEMKKTGKIELQELAVPIFGRS